MDILLQTNSELDKTQIAVAVTCAPEECRSHIKSPGNLTVLTQNIRSMYKNLDTFRVTLQSLQIDCDILVLTECQLSKYKPIPVLNDNYNTYYTKNTLNKCDGVVLYVKKNLNHSVSEPSIVNASCLLLTLPDTIIIGIYRTPSIRNTDEFVSSLCKLLDKYDGCKNIIITGDINIDIKPENLDSRSSNYLTSLSFHGILPAHRLLTRDKMCYDHMMIKTFHEAQAFVLTNAPTDHSTVLLNLLSQPTRRKCQKTRITINYDKVLDEIKPNLPAILEMTDPNQAAETLVNTISIAIKSNQHLTNIPSRKRCLQPWITPGVLRCLRNRDNLHKKVKKNPENEIIKITYSRYRNYCTKLVRKLKINYERDKLNSAANNPKTLWNTIKSICSINKRKTNDTDTLTTLSSSPVESANLINNHFAEVGKQLAEILMKSQPEIVNSSMYKVTSPANSFVLLNTDAYEINNIITNLPNSSAPGWDNITTKFIKLSKHVLIPIICHICNLCFENGVFPYIFKMAVITPIHKGGSSDDVNNYRPISVLPVMSKILEKLINNRLKKFLTDNNLISKNQYGFRSGLSTEDAVLNLTEEVTKHLDGGEKCVGVFLDLAKAFDTVAVSILLDKLLTYGIRGVPHSLLKDYLTDRHQKLKLGEYVSHTCDISFGVPQGSVLGPTLFLIYVNDLCNLVLPNCQIYTYADDTALIFHSKTWEHLKTTAEESISLVSNWLRANLLTLNVKKTKFLPFSIRQSSLPQNFLLKVHTCNNPQSITCECEEIDKVHQFKYLGVIIDQHLTWNPHINLTSDRLRKLMWVFKKLRQVANEELLISTYKALAHSVLSYCIPVWGGAAKTHLITLERAQRALLKTILFKPVRFPTFELHMSCKILTVRQTYILRSLLKKHTTLEFNQNYTLKRRHDIVCQIVKCNSTFAKKQFQALSSSLYNKINRISPIYPLTVSEVKHKLTLLLITLNYDNTESLLVT